MSSSPVRPGSPSGDQESTSGPVENAIPPESIKVMAESIGGPPIHEEATRELAEHATFRLRQLIQDSAKYSEHAKRKKLLCEDIDLALRMEGQEPLYGSVAGEHIPFRFASGGGRELHFAEDKEVDLHTLIAQPAAKVPLGVSLRAHWLAVDGVQPAIPENPPAQSKEQLRSEAANPLTKLKKNDAMDNKLGSLIRKPTKLKSTETVSVKQLAKHELSVEQQLYYKEITEACVGSDESRRAEALQSLACDPGLHQMLPRLCTFIAEGVRVNVVQHNLAILIYLMRMVKSLLENQTLFLEKYLHELIPAVTTCIVARQLCTRPDVDNHWALRDFASRLMANICKNFNTSTNNIQTRVTRMFCEALRSEKSPLVSYYGAIAGLQELGPEVIKVFIIPYIKSFSARIDQANETNTMSLPNIEKIAANHIRNLLIKSVVPVLKNVRPPPDVPDEYKNEFGSMGPYLLAAIQRARSSSTAAAAATPKGSGTPRSTTSQPPPPPSASVANPQGQRIYLMGTNTQPNQGQTMVLAPNQQRIVVTTASPSPNMGMHSFFHSQPQP